MSNIQSANSFERDFCMCLYCYGFWVHRMTQSAAGQPFDVIAARNGKTHVIDCKACAKNTFRLDRIEGNQISAMQLWRKTGNGDGWFALRLNTAAVYMIAFETLENEALKRTALNESEIKKLGIPLRKWVDNCI